MRLHRLFVPSILSGLTLAVLVLTAPASDPRRTPVVEVVEKVKGAVVNIHSERTRSFPSDDASPTAQSQNRVNGMGSGVIIDARGYIITNHHVVDDVSVLRAKFADGTSVPARIVARDAENDLALLKVDVTNPLPVAALGTATDLMVGETVIAIGNPYGYPDSVTTGVVSAIKRDVTLNKEVSYKSLIQTDARINPGNSGGPLFNIKGEVIGINVAIRAGAQGIGFAIPADTVVRIGAAMIASKRKTNLGLVCRDVLEKESDADVKVSKIGLNDSTNWSPVVRRTLLVDKVESNSAAAKAGLQPGDTLLQIGDVRTGSTLDLERALVERNAGDHVTFVIRRKSEEQRIEVALLGNDRGGPTPTELVWKKLGVRLNVVDADTVAKLNPQLHGGLTVTEVRPESAASRSGFQKGDILFGLHQWEMLNIDNVVYVLSSPDLPSFGSLHFFILRNGQVHKGSIQQLD
jgi:serine protease Do